MRIALALVLLAGVAHADGVARLVTSSYDDRGVTHYTWQIEVVSSSALEREVVVALEIPDTVAIDFMAMEANGERLVSTVLPAIEAEQTYRRVVESSSDPALLEWLAPGRLRLSVFPVSEAMPATITIEGHDGGESNVSVMRSLVAHQRGVRPILASATNPRSLGCDFRERVPLAPDWKLAPRPAGPERALDRTLVEVVPDQHQLRTRRGAAPRLAIRQ